MKTRLILGIFTVALIGHSLVTSSTEASPRTGASTVRHVCRKHSSVSGVRLERRMKAPRMARHRASPAEKTIEVKGRTFSWGTHEFQY